MTVDPIGFYNRRYRVSSGELNNHQLARLAPILRYVGTVARRPGLRLLDVGCGWVDRLWRRRQASTGFGLYRVALATRREDA